MTDSEVLEARRKNEIRLFDFFRRTGLPVDRLVKHYAFNCRNNKVEFYTLSCASEEEFESYGFTFYFAQNKGGDSYNWRKSGSNYFLSISVNDRWN